MCLLVRDKGSGGRAAGPAAPKTSPTLDRAVFLRSRSHHKTANIFQSSQAWTPARECVQSTQDCYSFVLADALSAAEQ